MKGFYMKFYKDNSADITKLFINQIGITIFGLLITMASVMSSSSTKGTFPLFCGIFSLGFYLYLVYVAVWDMGGRDKIRVEAGRLPFDKLKGAKLMLLAQVPNMVVGILLWIGAIFIAIGHAMADVGRVFYGVAQPIAKFTQAMYLGIVMQLPVEEAPLLTALVYTLTILPPLLVCGIGYYFGIKDIRFLTSPYQPKK